MILHLSGSIVDALRSGTDALLSIDLKPALEPERLDARLRRELDSGGRKRLRRVLETLLPKRLIPICLGETGLSPDLPAHQVTATNRRDLRQWLKDFRLQVTESRPIDEAIVTAGGVRTREIDPRTMASRLVPGLFFAGEVIDIHADTGGYNLQAAFSTGWLAGHCAADRVLRKKKEE